MNANKQDAGGEVTNPDNVGGLLPCPRCKSGGDRSVTARHLDYDVLLIRCDQCQWATALTEWNRHTSKPIIEIWNDSVNAELCRAAPAGGVLDGSLQHKLAQELDSAPAGSGEVLTEHGVKAIDRCCRELRQFIELAGDYDLDEMAVQALETAIESMEMRKASAMQAKEAK